MTTTTTQTREKIPNIDIAQNLRDVDIPRGPAQSKLSFFQPPADGATPYTYVEDPPEGTPKINYGTSVHDVTINDIRGREDEFDINVNGFGTLKGISSEVKDFGDDDQVKQVYYPEVEKLLLENVPGANRVFIFDHTVRRSGPNAARGPVNRAHIDQTAEAAVQRVNYHMGDEAPELLKHRSRLINVWRPLNGPVVANPLAYADSRSVADESVTPVEHRYPHRTGFTAGVSYREQAQWYYWSGMKNDERILLQCFDSKDGARTPHSAFEDPRTKIEWPGRESIEVRALVFG